MLRRRFLFSKGSVPDAGIQPNEIWYTTSDGKVLQTSSNSAFNSVDLVSNTYSDGKGVLKYNSPLTSLPLNMFRGCSKLTSVTMPTSIKTWGNYTFHSTGLTSIEVPEGVTTIGNEVFAGCSSLVSAIFSDSVTKIGTYTFLNCTALSSVKLPNSLSAISNYMFSGCSRLNRIDIPASVTSIGTEAFANCSNLNGYGVHITDLAKWCNITFTAYRSNPLYYGKKLYLNNSLVTNLAIPSGITTIKQYAFRACESITNITFPSSVTSIANYAFMHCTKLTNVVIPDSVTSIGGSSFEATTTTSLTELTIGSGVSSIGQNTFKAQTKLTKIYCKAATPPTIQSNTFESVPTSCVVYVPSASVSAYQSATYWKNFTITGYNF